MKSHFMKTDIKGLKDELEKLEDAMGIIEESFGEGLNLYVGECFVVADEDQANGYVTKIQEEKTEELDRKVEELEVIEGEMKELKTYLYARFGTSINLEEGAP
jgi:hypothetical protein